MVTICNFNPFMTNASIEFAKTVLAENGLGDIANDTVNFKNNIMRLFFARYFAGTNARNPSSNRTYQKLISMSIEQ
jgi:hypothetical protein